MEVCGVDRGDRASRVRFCSGESSSKFRRVYHKASCFTLLMPSFTSLITDQISYLPSATCSIPTQSLPPPSRSCLGTRHFQATYAFLLSVHFVAFLGGHLGSLKAEACVPALRYVKRCESRKDRIAFCILASARVVETLFDHDLVRLCVRLKA